MQAPSSELKTLYNQALLYQEQEDVYNAIKLFKRLTKLAPQWPQPFIQLSTIYKYRKEWKPALHYTKKVVALDPSFRTGWWNMGIAATALKKWRIAKRVWTKFGLSPEISPHPNPIGIKLEYNKHFEILWAKAINPAKAIINSIPHPASDRRFRDVVLYDESPSGYNVVRNKKHLVFDELGLLKRSRFKTFSALVYACDQKSLHLLEQLCIASKLGFENWSNTSRNLSKSKYLEFYGQDVLPQETGEATCIAIAAHKEEEVKQALHSWSVISLKQYSDLVQHL